MIMTPQEDTSMRWWMLLLLSLSSATLTLNWFDKELVSTPE